jgi:xylulose-5-phosphate/fructose-6-phosphate phosphoketolase
VRGNAENLKVLENWLKSYEPEKLFDADGKLKAELEAVAPTGSRRMSANPHANGGSLRKDLKLPDFRDYAVEVKEPGKVLHENTKPLGEFLRDVMRLNMSSFRVFGPDETASNRLQSIYEVSKKTWMAELYPEDADGGELARDGRVMEMLSEHTLLGWLEGLSSTGRHGFFHTYEAFCARIDSYVHNQHAKVARYLEEPRAVARVASSRTSCCRRPCGGRTTTASRIRTRGSSTS